MRNLGLCNGMKGKKLARYLYLPVFYWGHSCQLLKISAEKRRRSKIQFIRDLGYGKTRAFQHSFCTHQHHVVNPFPGSFSTDFSDDFRKIFWTEIYLVGIKLHITFTFVVLKKHGHEFFVDSLIPVMILFFMLFLFFRIKPKNLVNNCMQ